MLLKDRRCTSRRSKCSRNPDRQNTEAILQYSQDGTTMKKYRKSLSDIGWREHHIFLHDRIALETHIYKATRAERIQIANNWILAANSEGGTQLPLNQRPDFAQAKRECKRLHDEHLARTQQEDRDIPRSQQTIQRKRQQFEGHEDLTTSLTRTRVLDSTDSRAETCRHLRQARGPTCKQLRQRGTRPSGRRAIGILSILHVLTSGVFFSKLGQVSVAWRKTSSQPAGGGVNSTPTNTARTELHTAQSHFITRTCVAQELKDCTSLCP